VGYLVLSGIGALVWVSLIRVIKFKEIVSGLSHPADSIKENLEVSKPSFTELSQALEVISQTPSVGTQAAQVDWKRFWKLFSSDDELSDEEKSELAQLKQKMHELHSALEKEEKRRALEMTRTIHRRLLEIKISDDRGDYIIRREDYKRGSDKERDYIRLHRNFLYRTYDNRCAKCGNDSNGLDIDHFFFSKNEGGCFEMLHREGFKVNNAIPLCESCNRSKSDRHFKSFFSNGELVRVIECNIKMNERLNEKKINLWIRR
jgi:5-methylcytosine-specific restriction endonuclease McrA